MMAITLDDAKLYLRVDTDAEDALLIRLLNTSKVVVTDAVDNYDLLVKIRPDIEQKADMVQLAIIADLYENRNQDNPKDYGRVIETMIRQLQYESDKTAEELQAAAEALKG